MGGTHGLRPSGRGGGWNAGLGGEGSEGGAIALRYGGMSAICYF